MNRTALNRRFHALLAQKGLQDQKADLVHSQSQGRTDSLRELSDIELAALVQNLAARQAQESTSLKRMRAKVVAILCTLGYVTDQGKPDYPRINGWCSSRTAARKPLLEMTYEEVLASVNTAEQYKNHIASS